MNCVDDLVNQVCNGEIGLKAALETASVQKILNNGDTEGHVLYTLYKNKSIFVRTVTHYQVGLVEAVKDGFLILKNASWIADTGRFAEALKTGNLKEVEPFPDGVSFVSINAIVDGCEWKFPLPRTVI